MQGVAEFHKVSLNQFIQDSKKAGFIDDETDREIVKGIWESIKLPARATNGSAGYDFFLPWPFSLYAQRALTIPTGIRAEIQDGWVLVLVPRSGLGIRHGFRLVNTMGVIDSDYFHAENEGHILAGITVGTNLCLQDGDRFMQGIFLPYGLTRSDTTLSGERLGGFGSTGVG